jgi:hypothetical protein
MVLRRGSNEKSNIIISSIKFKRGGKTGILEIALLLLGSTLTRRKS